MEKMKMRPADLKETCERETKHHKLKIVCLSALMGSIAITYQSYFDNLVMRSGMFQQHALAGKVRQIDYIDVRNDQSLEYANDGYYDGDSDWATEAQERYHNDKEGQLRREFDDWRKMHNDNVIWFDTSACLDAPHIGEVNKASSSGSDVSKVNTWNASYGTLAITNNYAYNDVEIYRDFRRDWLQLFEECDIDCQAKGSQLTLIAGLLGLVYFLVSLNALAMFIGTWRYRWRVCSVYFTHFVCMFQLAVLIATGALLFTRYNSICSKSMRTTSVWDTAFIWTMADDFYTVYSMWIASFFLMFGFVGCSFSQVKREKMM